MPNDLVKGVCWVCRQVSAHFEVFDDLSPEQFEAAVTSTASRSLTRFGWTAFDDSSEVQRVLLAREFLKGLCGVTFLSEAVEALVEANAKLDGKAKYLGVIEEMLTPDDRHSGRRSYVDPMAWSVKRVPAVDRRSRILRLVLFVEGVLEQELAFRDEGMTIEQAIADALGHPFAGPPRPRTVTGWELGQGRPGFTPPVGYETHSEP